MERHKIWVLRYDNDQYYCTPSVNSDQRTLFLGLALQFTDIRAAEMIANYRGLNIMELHPIPVN